MEKDIINILYIIPQDVCMIIKQYYEGYKSCEFVDSYYSANQISRIYSACLFNNKIYMAEFSYSKKKFANI